jgi:hypothetical protein
MPGLLVGSAAKKLLSECILGRVSDACEGGAERADENVAGAVVDVATAACALACLRAVPGESKEADAVRVEAAAAARGFLMGRGRFAISSLVVKVNTAVIPSKRNVSPSSQRRAPPGSVCGRKASTASRLRKCLKTGRVAPFNASMCVFREPPI